MCFENQKLQTIETKSTCKNCDHPKDPTYSSTTASTVSSRFLTAGDATLSANCCLFPWPGFGVASSISTF
uniref:Uncharacterized protein n=1 Tax=Salix viminalis TaxID=40686 RepID=A0A6N2LLP4_SALVM